MHRSGNCPIWFPPSSTSVSFSAVLLTGNMLHFETREIVCVCVGLLFHSLRYLSHDPASSSSSSLGFISSSLPFVLVVVVFSRLVCLSVAVDKVERAGASRSHATKNKNKNA